MLKQGRSRLVGRPVRLGISLVMVALVVTGTAFGTGVREEQTDFTLQLLHFADIDGQPEAIDNVGRFSQLVSEFRSEMPASTLVVSSGDNFIPGPRYFASGDEAMSELLGVAGEGRADIIILNELGVAASAVGNHDLDGGPGGFVSSITAETTEAGSFPGSSFPYLAANVDFLADEATAPLAAEGGQPVQALHGRLAPSALAIVGGEVIGLVGAVTPRLGSITSTGDLGIMPSDGSIRALATVIQRAVDRLTEQGVDKIVVLSHMQQIAIEKELAGYLEDVDIIVGGGSNSLFADGNDELWPGDEAVDTYPVVMTDAGGKPILIVNVDGDYRYLGRLVVGFDRNGVILPDTLDATVNGSYATHREAMPAVGARPDPQIEAVVAGIQEVLQRREGNILGRSNVYLDGRRGQVRTQETNLGNITADANLWYAKQYDPDTVISLKNGGGIRAPIGASFVPAGSVDYTLVYGPPQAIPSVGKPEGGISQFDIEGSLRFNNALSLLTVTARELRGILEHAVAASAEGATPGQFPQIGGMHFSFDPSRQARTDNASGSRVRDLVIVNDAGRVTDRVVVGGELQGDPSRTFRLVTLSFLADGGDGYPFDQLSVPNRVDLAEVTLDSDPGSVDFAPLGTEQDALAEYLSANHGSARTAISMEETDPAEDERIQNLNHRSSSLR